MKSAKKVIIIEDDADISTLISYNLLKEGYAVEQVFDGLKASQKLKKEHFDIAIVDIMLPQMDGFSICELIKQAGNPLNTFVIVVSAKSSQQDKLHAHIMGADCYFTKPFDISELVMTINEFSALQDKQFVVNLK